MKAFRNLYIYVALVLPVAIFAFWGPSRMSGIGGKADIAGRPTDVRL